MARKPETIGDVKAEELGSIPVDPQDRLVAVAEIQGMLIAVSEKGVIFRVEVVHGR